MKICTNCKHSFFYESPPSMVFCKHPNLGINPVDGKVPSTFAITMRAEPLFKQNAHCGPDGNWYEEKEPPVGAPKGWWSFLRGGK